LFAERLELRAALVADGQMSLNGLTLGVRQLAASCQLSDGVFK